MKPQMEPAAFAVRVSLIKTVVVNRKRSNSIIVQRNMNNYDRL
jgi:hypothetical protein